MKSYYVTYTITGRASATIEANSLEEAKAKAEKYEIEVGSDDVIEWDFDEIEGVGLND